MSGTSDPQVEATIEKIRAEAEKLRAEAREAARPPLLRPSIWITLLVAIAGGASGFISTILNWQIKTADFTQAQLKADKATLELERKAHDLERKQEQLQRGLDQLDARRLNVAREVAEAERRFAEVKDQLQAAEQRLASATNTIASASCALASGAHPPAATAAVQQDLTSARSALGSATQLLAAPNATVFLQFRGEVAREELRGLQTSLSEAGFRAPGIQRVAGDYGNEVRFFHAEDQAAAEAVAARVQAHFTGDCRLRGPVSVRRVSLPAPRGQIEVWIGATEGTCRG